MKPAMENLQLTQAGIPWAGRLIHKRLEVGRQIGWEWEMYSAATPVDVQKLVAGEKIRARWDGQRQPSKVPRTFSDGKTSDKITTRGFSGNGDKIVEQAMGSEAGSALDLAGLEAYVGAGIELQLAADRFPNLVIKDPPVKPYAHPWERRR
jgi:hypothetical protein